MSRVVHVAGLVPGSTINGSTVQRQQLLRPYPAVLAFGIEENVGSDRYNGVTALLEKRFSADSSMTFQYTYSQLRDKRKYLNPADNTLEDRVSPDDRPNRLSLGGILQLPFGHGAKWGNDWNTIVDAFIGGWQVSGTYQYQDGFPLVWGNLYWDGACGDPKSLQSYIGDDVEAGVAGLDVPAWDTRCFYFHDAAVQTNGVDDPSKQRADQRIQLGNNVRYFPSTLPDVRTDTLPLLDVGLSKNFHLPRNMRGPDNSPREVDLSDVVLEAFRKHKTDAHIAVGGDGSLTIALQLHRKGLHVVGVPKTIDNGLRATTTTFGFSSAVSFATECIDRLHQTAKAHRRIMVVEVMGRYAGWIALHCGIAGEADAILIPEIPYDIRKVAGHLKKKISPFQDYAIVVVAEGAKPVGGDLTVKRREAGRQERLGGLGDIVARELQELTGYETRAVEQFRRDADGLGLLVGLDHESAAVIAQSPDLLVCLALDGQEGARGHGLLDIYAVPEADPAAIILAEPVDAHQLGLIELDHVTAALEEIVHILAHLAAAVVDEVHPALMQGRGSFLVTRQVNLPKEGRTDQGALVVAHIVPGDDAVHPGPGILLDNGQPDNDEAVQQAAKLLTVQQMIGKPIGHAAQIDWRHHEAGDSADAQWLKQALINLLDNSLKYTPPGGSVTVRLRRSDGSVEIAVRDTGPGIEAEHVPFLFDRFYRADKARARESGGTGLGLAIVKGIVEAHGGTVSVETQPGQGAEFTIRLPLGRAPDGHPVN